MNSMEQLAKMLIGLGVAAVMLGCFLLLAFRVPTLRIGRLPGDISAHRGNFSIYFPLATCVVISLAVTLAMWLFRYFRR